MPDEFALGGREVCIWYLELTADDCITARFQSMLTPEEVAHAARFRFEHLRRSYVFSRGALRLLLGRYLGIQPGCVPLSYGSKGKPRVEGLGAIEFNVAHSGNIALLGFTVGCEIGIDLEQIRPLQNSLEIANRFFCGDEVAELASLSTELRERAFFLSWTRKEACIKAIGDGLSAPLDSFRVTMHPDAHAQVVHINGNFEPAGEWTLHDLELGPKYAGALAYRGAPRRIHLQKLLKPAELFEMI